MFSWQYGNSSLQVNLSGIPWSIETLQLEFLLSLSAQLSGTELRLQLHVVGTKDSEPRRMFTKKVLIPTLFFPHLQKSKMTHVTPRATPVLSMYEMHLFRGEGRKRGSLSRQKSSPPCSWLLSSTSHRDKGQCKSNAYDDEAKKLKSFFFASKYTNNNKNCSHQSSTNTRTLTSFQRIKWAPPSHLLKCICPLTTDQAARFTLVKASQKNQEKVAGKMPHSQPQPFWSWETRGANPLFPRCR